MREVLALDDFEEGEEGNGAAADGHVGGEAVGKPAFEEVDLVSVGFEYDNNGLEESIRGSGRQVAGATGLQGLGH